MLDLLFVCLTLIGTAGLLLLVALLDAHLPDPVLPSAAHSDVSDPQRSDT